MGDSFRDAAWDNQLDNMLDDLQSSVSSRGETHGYKNGYHSGPGHTSREYQERQHGNTREVREKVTHVAGGPGEGYSYREESQFMSSSSSSGGPMGSKKAIQNGGNMEQHIIDEKKSEYDGGMRGRSDSLVSDLTSIAKIRSVSKSSTSHSSSERYEYSSSSQQQVNGNPTPTSNTQQSIKKNINDLDNLLSNLSSHNTSATIGGLSRASSKPASREGSPSRRGYTGHSSSHVSRSEERRERLMSNASQYRSPSLSRPPSRPASRPPSRPHSPAFISNGGHGGYPGPAEFSSQQMTMTSTMRSNVSGASSMGGTGELFRPVHTTPDPLTGRYADGRITPNHGYTRNFVGGTSPMPPRKVTQTESNNGIPRKADELLSSLGHQVDSREIQRITQEETTIQHQKEKEQRKLNAMGDENFIPTKNVAGPPVFYPQGDLFTKNKEDVKAREAELSAQGQYFSASYAAERGARTKEESGEKGGAAVIPICLPLCCAAPCVIM